jgi:hypothetical protein
MDLANPIIEFVFAFLVSELLRAPLLKSSNVCKIYEYGSPARFVFTGRPLPLG